MEQSGECASGAPLKREQAGGAAKRGKTRLIIAMGVGNFLEIYDFIVYSYFAAIIGAVMLKTDNPLLSAYISLIIFGIGFLARPLGSFVLGGYADKYGRKPVLLITVMLMGAGCACIGFAPPYAAAGVFAPITVLVGRLLQGFSAGGEIGSASALMLESAGERRRGLYVASQFMMYGAATVAGALTAFVLFACFSEAQMRSWGWRLPFIFALLIIPVGLYLRRHIDETHNGAAAERAALPHPMRLVWRKHRRLFLTAVLSVWPVSAISYGIILFMPAYLSLLSFSGGAAALSGSGIRFAIAAAMGILMTAGSLLGGLAADRLRRRKRFVIACLALSFIGCFILYASAGAHLALFLLSAALLVLINGMMHIIQAMIALEAFPRAVRVTGFSVSLALGHCLFGGTAQAVLAKLLLITSGNPFAPFYYLGPVMLIGIVIYALFPEQTPCEHDAAET